jgi:hypothetical protein
MKKRINKEIKYYKELNYSKATYLWQQKTISSHKQNNFRSARLYKDLSSRTYALKDYVDRLYEKKAFDDGFNLLKAIISKLEKYDTCMTKYNNAIKFNEEYKERDPDLYIEEIKGLSKRYLNLDNQ